ncbi:hypothetical protein EVAR_13496_1 [Eumeta japonica]|uniref:Uncharacterized protein n=1 Tax=Eumeta variegata TaxID=151549 RepID=A0A4C1UZC8_EUMVA|nr:hypothetical protein EVAR_13496_1 [Eumeta japonica]
MAKNLSVPSHKKCFEKVYLCIVLCCIPTAWRQGRAHGRPLYVEPEAGGSSAHRVMRNYDLDSVLMNSNTIDNSRSYVAPAASHGAPANRIEIGQPFGKKIPDRNKATVATRPERTRAAGAGHARAALANRRPAGARRPRPPTALGAGRLYCPESRYTRLSNASNARAVRAVPVIKYAAA